MTKEKVKPGRCRRCGCKIHNKENYCKLSQWSKGEIISEGWYHVVCFREGIHGTAQEREVVKKASEFMDKALSLVGGFE